MGHSSVSFHFRASDETALNMHLAGRGISHFLIAPAKNGWVSLYEERASRQNENRICDLAAGLSADLKTAAIAFSVHDSDIACYWLYENGTLLDKFNSCPDYFGGGPVSATARGGQPDILLHSVGQASQKAISRRFWVRGSYSLKRCSTNYVMRKHLPLRPRL